MPTFTLSHNDSRTRCQAPAVRTNITSPDIPNPRAVLRIDSHVTADGKRIKTVFDVYTPEEGFFRYQVPPQTLEERRTTARTEDDYSKALQAQRDRHTTARRILEIITTARQLMTPQEARTA